MGCWWHFGGPCASVALHPPACPHSRHLFAIANVAYSKVMDAKHNQCIIIRWDMAVLMHLLPLGCLLINTPPANFWVFATSLA